MSRLLGDFVFALTCLSWAFGPSPLLGVEPGISGTPWRRHIIDDASRGADGVRLADANGDGRPDITTGWEQGGAIRICFHPGPAGVKEKWPAVTVGNVPGVEDAVAADLDGDGVVDVISSAEGKSRTISLHWGPASPQSLRDATAWQTVRLPASNDKMMWMFALPLQLDGRHGLDLVAGGKSRDAALGWFEAPANPRELADWQWHELRRVGWLMSIVAADMDGDGDADIVFTDRKGPASGAYWLENPGAGPLQRSPWREHTIGVVQQPAMFLQLADFDGDRLQDVFVAVQPKEIVWLRRLDRTGDAWQMQSLALPEPTGIAKAVSVGDLDGDGQLDLVFSCEQATAPRHGLVWLKATGSRPNNSWQARALSGVDGVKHDLVELLDLDGDGDLDAITTEEVKNLGVIWYENPLR